MHPDLAELLRFLRSDNVEFLVVGSTALAVHTRPRYTEDLDFWIPRPPQKTDEPTMRATRLEFGLGKDERDPRERSGTIRLVFQSIRIWAYGSAMRGPFRAGISARTTTQGHRNDPGLPLRGPPRFRCAPFPFGGVSRTRLRGQPDDVFLTVGDLNSPPIPLVVSTAHDGTTKRERNEPRPGSIR
jgi:hypothetical protein